MGIGVACGREPHFTKICVPTPVESRFIFNQNDMEELRKIDAKYPKKIIRIVDFYPENIG